MGMRISFVTHQADDPLQKRRSSPACSLRPSLWSSIRMKAMQGLLPNEDSCHRWHPDKWCDPNSDIMQCSFSGKETLYAGNIWEWMWGFIIQHFLTKKPLCSRNTITGEDKAYGSWPIITSLNEAFFIRIWLHLERAGEFQNILGVWSWIELPKGLSEKKVYEIRLLTRETENSGGDRGASQTEEKREIGQERENTRETVEEESKETEKTGLKLSFE